MSIVLKTDPADLNNDTWKVSNAIHDCRAAHAMQMAIAHYAAAYDSNGARWINERAAANLARLLGEGNG